MRDNSPVFEAVFSQANAQSILVYQVEVEAFEPFWHFHPEIELTLITQGSGIRFVGDHIENYQEGDLVLIGADLPHHWVSTDTGGGMQKAIVVQFQERFLEEMSEFDSLLQFVQTAKVGLHFPQPSEEVLDKISGLSQLPAPIRVSRMIEILYLLSQYSAPRTLSRTTKFNLLDSNKEQKKINEAISYVVQHLNQTLTVSRMAEHCCMVPQAFCRWFRKHTGFSFITYLNKTRVESACQLLLTTELPVKSIAFEVGFENVSHFHRTFKKYVGISPLGYKKQHL